MAIGLGGGSAPYAAARSGTPRSDPRVLGRAVVTHRLSFAGLWLFTLVLYLRPNDLLPIGTFPVAKIIALGTLAVFLIERLSLRGSISVMPLEFKYLLGLLALMIISAPLAIDSASAFDAVSDEFLKAVLIFMLMINVVIFLKNLRALLVLTTICGTFIAWGAIQEFFIGGHLIGGYRAQGIGGGMFGNPNDLALALNMFIPLALGLALSQGNTILKLLYFGCVGVMVAAVLVTYSRGGFLALLGVGGYMLLGPGRRNRSLTGLALAGGVLGILFAPEGYGIRVASIFDTTLDPVGSADARWSLLTRSVEALGANPKRWLFGVGPNNFSIVSIHDQVNHNAYLQVLTEVGLPALVLYLMFLVSVLRSTGRIARTLHGSGESNAISVTAMAIQGSLIAYVVGSFFASVAYLWYLYYTAGYAVCLRQLVEPARNHAGSSSNR